MNVSADLGIHWSHGHTGDYSSFATSRLKVNGTTDATPMKLANEVLTEMLVNLR